MLHTCDAAAEPHCTALAVLLVGEQDLIRASRWVRDLLGFTETATAIL